MIALDRVALKAQLLEDEGIRLRPYQDTRGKWTIGIGRNLTDAGITTEEATMLFDNDVDACLADLYTFGWFLPLDAVRLRAVIDLRFNLGRGKLRSFVKFLAAMEKKDYGTAADELLNSAWASQVQPSRRDRIVAQIRTGAEA